MSDPIILTDLISFNLGEKDGRKRIKPTTDFIHLIDFVYPNLRMITDLSIGKGDYLTIHEIDLMEVD